ncbi:MAG: hypothetical protein K0V04_36825 [Deltaproteobacteria bacterium]|nr:hypothetical protein [Deltaproteobacteria bacterium]
MLPQAEVSETPVELRASGEGPSSEIVKNGQKIAQAIVADEAFVELIEVGAEVMGDVHQAQQKLSGEALDGIAVTTTAPAFGEVMGPGTLLAHLGGNPKLLDSMQYLVNEIRDNHDLQGASAQDVRYVFELALETNEGNAILAAAVEDELVLSIYNPCKQLCYNAYVAAMVIPLALFVLEMVLAAATFPFGLLIAMFAIAMLNASLTMAGVLLDQCIAECGGAPPVNNGGNPALCGGDSCNQNEYCWKGVLGIGKDECRTKRGQGNVCSSHGQCQTNCCKYHTWSNPVSKTCRPANACN